MLRIHFECTPDTLRAFIDVPVPLGNDGFVKTHAHIVDDCVDIAAMKGLPRVELFVCGILAWVILLQPGIQHIFAIVEKGPWK